jgi:hypothetical protein
MINPFGHDGYAGRKPCHRCGISHKDAHAHWVLSWTSPYASVLSGQHFQLEGITQHARAGDHHPREGSAVGERAPAGGLPPVRSERMV